MSDQGRCRRLKPDAAEDALEERWWNDHAELVEAVWAMPMPLRKAIRLPYLQRATRFLLQDAKTAPAQLLEVGCGSGWVGQLLAKPGKLHLTGLDLSAGQLKLAQESAARLGLEECCRYERANLGEYALQAGKTFDGVLLHAILHHLTVQEIDSIFKEIATLGKGTKVFFYEPVFLKAKSAAPQWLRQWLRHPLRTAQHQAAQYQDVYDVGQAMAVQEMCQASQQQGWVLSPKEVVFQEDELAQLLQPHFRIRQSYVCNYLAVPVAQAACFHADKALWQELAKTALTRAVWLDRLLDATGWIRSVAEDYVFMGYECEVR